MLGIAHSRRRSGEFPARILLIALAILAAGGVVAVSLVLDQHRTPSPVAFAFPPFRLVYERWTSGSLQPIRYELEWRDRNDWTERLIRGDGSVGLVTREVSGGQVIHYGMGATDTYTIGDDSVHVPGVWFRDIVATIPSSREARTDEGPITTVTRKTPIDVEEWDADSATGIPLGYRQIGDGKVVQEFRVISLLLADGTVIR
jgi:hypothetical protein